MLCVHQGMGGVSECGRLSVTINTYQVKRMKIKKTLRKTFSEEVRKTICCVTFK